MARHAELDRTTDAVLAAGTPVRVRTRFDGGWADGFAIADVVTGGPGAAGYRLRRAVDGCILPAVFSPDDVMPVSSAFVSTSFGRR